MRERLKAGDLIIWEDGTPGILLSRFDMYAGPDGSSGDYPTWCWHIAFNGHVPRNYNQQYGACETNLFNLGMVRRGRG